MDVALGIAVAGTVVAVTGTLVEVSTAGTVVFVGWGTAVVSGGVMFIDRSHARVTTINREINKKSFFTIVLCMAKFPFMHNDSK